MQNGDATNKETTTPIMVDPALPVLLGHFPGAPLVPGALQLEWMIQSLPDGKNPTTSWTVKSAKFLKPLLPGTSAHIRTSANANTFRCSIESVEGTHSSATFILQTP
jgi:3-hydroxymyristoyl/3-hydroxydecanoyl-(acyl carrier protein) dehydratase